MARVLTIRENRMPRYFFKIGSSVETEEDGGVELPDRDALRVMIRRTLTAMLRDEADNCGVNALTAKVYDEDRRLVMRAQVSLTVVEL
jgi:hypothetical protein